MARKPEKLDRQTRKNIGRVIGKYVDRSNKYMLPAVYTGAGALSLAALAVDVMGGGGLASLTLHSFILPTAFTLGGGTVLYGMRVRERPAANGQRVIASEIVTDTLDKMETRLQKAFAKAAKPDAAPADKSELQFVIDDVRADLKALSPAFRIVSADGIPGEAQDYLFVVERRRHENGMTEEISLARKLAEMAAAQDRPAPPAPPAAPDKPLKKGGFSL